MRRLFEVRTLCSCVRRARSVRTEEILQPVLTRRSQTKVSDFVALNYQIEHSVGKINRVIDELFVHEPFLLVARRATPFAPHAPEISTKTAFGISKCVNKRQRKKADSRIVCERSGQFATVNGIRSLSRTSISEAISSMNSIVALGSTSRRANRLSISLAFTTAN